jgi:hypothetical protein
MSEPTVEDLPIIEEEIVTEDEPQVEIDPELTDSPELREAIHKAQLGIYEHTMFEMWEEVLNRAIYQANEPMSIPVAHGLIKQYPWLRHKDIPMYLQERVKCIEEAGRVLQSCYPKDRDELFKESGEQDWKEHSEAYREVIIRWTRLTNRWSDRWEQIPLHRGDKGIMHAVIADATSLLVHPKSGLLENIQHLFGFEVTEKQAAADRKRIDAEHDWSDDV